MGIEVGAGALWGENRSRLYREIVAEGNNFLLTNVVLS
jgi:hypothetical protein